MNSIVNKLSWILTLLAFAIVGALLGWLIGASNSPVVASAIPLVAGLAGGFSFRYLERRAAEDSYAEKLKTATDDSETRKKIARSLGLDQRVTWMPAFWALAVILFSICTYLGVLAGVDGRVASQNKLSDILTSLGADPKAVVGEDRVVFQNALFRLRAVGATDDEIYDIFKFALCPLLESKPQEDEKIFGNDLSSIVAELFDGMDTKKQTTGRGPASVPEIE